MENSDLNLLLSLAEKEAEIIRIKIKVSQRDRISTESLPQPVPDDRDLACQHARLAARALSPRTDADQLVAAAGVEAVAKARANADRAPTGRRPSRKPTPEGKDLAKKIRKKLKHQSPKPIPPVSPRPLPVAHYHTGLTVLEYSKNILRTEKKPMTGKMIYEYMINHDYISTAKTPWATIHSALHRDSDPNVIKIRINNLVHFSLV